VTFCAGATGWSGVSARWRAPTKRSLRRLYC